jgi:hypothetical protein
MTLIFCLWLANQWIHTIQEQADTVALDLGAVVYNTIVAATMLTQLVLWIVYMKLQADLSSPALSYDFYDNRETSRARFLLPYKVDNASSTAVDSGGDEAFAGNLRWPLKTNNTGLDTYAAMLHSMSVLQTLQVCFACSVPAPCVVTLYAELQTSPCLSYAVMIYTALWRNFWKGSFCSLSAQVLCVVCA